MNNNNLFVYEATVSRQAIEGILDSHLTDAEWEYIQERMTDMIDSIGTNCAFGYERLDMALYFYRNGAN
jgi:hypothetical protein